MNVQTDWLSIYLAFIGTIISALLAYLSYSLNRQAQRTAMQHSIQQLYDGMIKYRTAQPDVMKLCYRWNDESFNAIYRQQNKEELQWLVYYNYVEIISGLINAILYGRKTGLLDKYAYRDHYEPLLKLLLTENHPYFSSVLPGPYLSMLIKTYIQELTAEGWDFTRKHQKLIGAAYPTELPDPPESPQAQ